MIECNECSLCDKCDEQGYRDVYINDCYECDDSGHECDCTGGCGAVTADDDCQICGSRGTVTCLICRGTGLNPNDDAADASVGLLDIYDEE